MGIQRKKTEGAAGKLEINAFYLMNKDRPLTLVSFTDKGDIIDYSREYKNKDFLPVASRNDEDWLYAWWKERTVPVTRKNIHQLLASKGMSLPEEYLFKNLGLSLNDCYWIKPVDSNLSWGDVNLYTNKFKDNTLQLDSESKNGTISYLII